MFFTKTYSGSVESMDEMDDDGEWKRRPSRRVALVRGEVEGVLISGSRRKGVVPSTAPSLRVDRRRRVRSSAPSVLLVGGQIEVDVDIARNEKLRRKKFQSEEDEGVSALQDLINRLEGLDTAQPRQEEKA